MSLVTYPLTLTTTGSTVFTAGSTALVLASIHNEIGSKAYLFVVRKGETPPVLTSFLFIGGVVFPASIRARGQDDLIEVLLNPGDVLLVIMEKGAAVAIITTHYLP